LLQRKSLQSDLKARDETPQAYHHRRFLPVAVGLLAVLMAVLAVAVLVGKNQQGWTFTTSLLVFEFRAPRVFVALLAGIGLAFAGTIIQRVSNNPMASPEILGISSGAALALVIGAMLGVAVERHEQMLLGTTGALLVTGLVWLLGKRHNFAPSQTLLTGIALSAGLDAFLRIAMSSGQDNVQALLTWLSGSTYLVSYSDIALLLVGVILVGGIALASHRWVELIGLGEVTASSIGLDCRKVRLMLLILVAALTTLCTIVIGPLSFIGLLAPHMARSLNQYRASSQMMTAALIGGVIMVAADWMGRVLWFPWQFPAGLLASLLGGAYFLYLMRK
ncbi:iron ABC transporter permease, partial [Photobacterium sanctipauli]